MKRSSRSFVVSLCGIALAMISPAPAKLDSTQAAKAPAGPAGESRHYDARLEFNKGFAPAKAAPALQAAQSLARALPELSVAYDEPTGAVRSLSAHVGYLTPARPGEDALEVARQYVHENLALLGLEESDLADYEVTDRVVSRVSGVSHIYLRQTYRGLPVYNTQLHMNVDPEGRLISVNNSFLPGLARSAGDVKPALDLGGAVLKAAGHLGIALAAAPRRTAEPEGVAQVSTVENVGVSRQPIKGQLMWLPIRAGMARLVWNFTVHTADRQHIYDMTVDGADGRVWTRFDQVASDTYRVYARPAESPNHVSPAPPADGRTLLTNPANALASPFGWHDTNGAAGAEFTTTQGNNVQAYTDTDNNNSPDAGSSPSGGAGLNFDFALDHSLAPSGYRPAAVTNLFYVNNLIHDVQYQYGFDEAAGNFQTNNYGRGGAGNDSVMAEAQDGGGTNNANFATPADGSRPRMQMYVWTAPTPDRDGDVDNGIIIHEYGHGISNRLVGGPANVNCLTNSQQPGEGLSDWWALAYTAEVGDAGTDGRGIGTYALNQPTTGVGIRTQRYSTNPSINTWTYASINGMAIPHGVGSVWAQGAWEVYWKLVDQWGFDPNIYNATGSAGNQRMMLYVNEGLQNTACNPTFTQVRDGIIQAATALHGGEDVCRMWEAFAAYGLGTNAVSGGANSTSPTNGFNIPASCQQTGNLPPVANAGPDQNVTVNTLVTLNGSGSSDPDSGPSPLTFSWAQISGTSVTLNGATTASPTFTPTVAGAYGFRLTVSDGAATATDTVTVTATGGGGGGGQTAVFDAARQAPTCATVGSSCDTGAALVLGRDGRGPEPNQPNTIADSCADGTSGVFHSDESNDRLAVSTLDGSSFAAGKTVRIDATVWAWTTPAQDKLDLYFAANATSPTWTFLTTLTPTVAGAQTLSATYTLPAGALQAVRAQMRYQGAASACTAGGFNDRDDLVFAVTSAAPVTVFSDDFETDKLWTVNPSATDTATTGQWERGVPQATNSAGVKQLGTTVSGTNDLVTGRLAGAAAGDADIDGGVTSIRSPAITLPSGNLSLSFSYYLAHGTNATSADFLRVSIVGTTTAVVFQELGAADNDDAAWASTTVSLNAFAGQTVRILVEAADAATASLVEAGIDDVRITQP